MGDLSSCVPCRAGCKFRLFQQNNIRPAFMREVIGKATPHYATPDDNDARLCWKM